MCISCSCLLGVRGAVSSQHEAYGQRPRPSLAPLLPLLDLLQLYLQRPPLLLLLLLLLTELRLALTQQHARLRRSLIEC